MGTPCTSGTPQAKPGVGTVVALTFEALERIFSRAGYGWLAAIATILPIVAVDTDDYCADGQPSLPTFTATDAQAMLNLAPWDEFTVAMGKLRDIFLHYLWWELCECAGGTTPGLTTPQTPPDITAIPGTGQGTACHLQSNVLDSFTDPGGAHYRLGGNLGWYSGFGGASINMYPNVPRTIRVTHHRERIGTAAREELIPQRIRFSTSGFGTLVQEITDVSGDDWEWIGSPPPGAVILESSYRIDVANSSDIMHTSITAYCDQLPASGTPAGCCPPDPTIIAMLSNVLQQLQLVQRQAVPFAYVPGATHSGLTGHGELTVQGLIGARLTITDTPNWVGITDGDPDVIWPNSWINWGNADGFADRQWITASPQVSFPALAGQYTRIGYSLAAGVELELQELVREP